jgi:3-oxoadipate enol-lactonase
MHLQYDITGAGPPLLFLHGALVSSQMWHPQRVFFRQHYQVITCDLPAHGGSPDVDGAYSIPALTARVVQLLDTLGIEQTHVCGHSLGGMVAQQLAGSYPQRIGKLVLAETAYGTRNTVWERLQTRIARPLLWLTPQRTLVQLSVRQYGMRSPETAQFIRQEMARYTHATSVRVMSAAFRFAGKEHLRSITAPTLVLVAEDNRQTHAQGRQMAQRIPDARFAVIPQAHHLLNLDNPTAFNRQVRAFLSNGHPDTDLLS